MLVTGSGARDQLCADLGKVGVAVDQDPEGDALVDAQTRPRRTPTDLPAVTVQRRGSVRGVLFARFRRSRSPDQPRDADRVTASRNPLRPLYDSLTGDNMPASLTPGTDPKKSQVFDDEIDPSWRDPDRHG